MPLSDEQIDGIIERTCGYYAGPMLTDLRALCRAVEEAVAPAYAELLNLEELHAKQSDEQAARIAELEAEHRSLETTYLQRGEVIDTQEARIAELKAERDDYRSKFYAVLEQARVWSCEAKTQRATVNEVGEREKIIAENWRRVLVVDLEETEAGAPGSQPKVGASVGAAAKGAPTPVASGWTAEPPTEPGWYWMRPAFGDDAVVELKCVRPQAPLWVHRYGDPVPLSEFNMPDPRWHGPLRPPEDQG